MSAVLYFMHIFIEFLFKTCLPLVYNVAHCLLFYSCHFLLLPVYFIKWLCWIFQFLVVFFSFLFLKVLLDPLYYIFFHGSFLKKQCQTKLCKECVFNNKIRYDKFHFCVIFCIFEFTVIKQETGLTGKKKTQNLATFL